MEEDKGLESRSVHHHGLKQIKVRRETDDESGEEDHQEPLSPMVRMFHEPESDVYIIVSVGFKSPIDPNNFKANLSCTLLKHPRFSSLQVADEKNGGELKWVQTEKIMSPTKTKISMSIPIWDCHILNLKTSDAESTLDIRAHHSLGDGTSLMSLFHSCSRKVSDPDSLPSFPAATKKSRSSNGWFWRFMSVLLLIWNTLVDIWMCLATTYDFLKDTQTPIKAPSTVAFTSRGIVRRTFSLGDIKLVKNATNTTVNDVVLAITQAGLSRYLNRKYGELKKRIEEAAAAAPKDISNLPKNIVLRVRATLFINLRSSPGIYVKTTG
ncbi:hypothetical protein DITRI_Ditri08aG0143000 [Diplodiscus trichospermus]